MERLRLATIQLFDCFGDRFDKNGAPKVFHSLAVGEAAARRDLGPAAICAAILHDVLEDADDPVAAEVRMKREQSVETVAMVICLTRHYYGEETYMDFIRRIARTQRETGLPVGTLKGLDIDHNMGRMDGLAKDNAAFLYKRYTRARKILCDFQ